MTTPKSSKSEMPNSVRVDWNDVGLVATMKGVEDKHILRKVSGFAVPGELLAIMGPSGAGKTSLLNCLAVRTAPTSGELTFNATCPYSQSLKGRVAYVHQQEMLLESYTPREHLLFQSTLRMPRDVTKAQREQRVDASIKMCLTCNALRNLIAVASKLIAMASILLVTASNLIRRDGLQPERKRKC
ncbi:unnamed protein product [Durusdinium trenchii]|uniref:AAA+ ATPase domain-containing protein n=1 Tax=Durusdinium trenchii TaxID=1381693 RepID=A0ABP0HPN0_9DINO